MKRLLLSTLFIISSILSVYADYKVIGYVTTYSALYSTPSLTPFSKVTHVNIAFVNPTDATGNSLNLSTSKVTAFTTLAHSYSVKVLISLAGAMGKTDTRFTYLKTIISDNTLRGNFEDKLVAFINANNLDGLDIDIETDLLAALCQNGTYDKFISELRTKLTTAKLLTVALPTGFYANLVSSTTLQIFDWVNVMSYDKTGTWTGAGEHASFDDFIVDEDYYINGKNMAYSKVVMGVPFYGYGWADGKTNVAASYGYLVSQSPDAILPDNYLNPSTGYDYYYNGKTTMLAKAKEVYNQGLGGIMIWELSQDAASPNSLLDVIHTVIPLSANDELVEDVKFSVYPNPAKNMLHMESMSAGTYTLTDIEGKTVLSGQLVNELTKELVLQSISPGVYILKFYSAQDIIIKKIIVE